MLPSCRVSKPILSEWHEPLRQALVSRKGSVLTNRELDDLISEVPGIGSKAQYIHPSDHCVNMNNKGACRQGKHSSRGPLLWNTFSGCRFQAGTSAGHFTGRLSYLRSHFVHRHRPLYRNPPTLPEPASASDVGDSLDESGLHTSGTLLCMIECAVQAAAIEAMQGGSCLRPE